MSSKRAEPPSIASQLVLLSTLAATLVISCGLGALYLIVVRHSLEEDNAVLNDKAAILQRDFEKHGDAQALRPEFQNRSAFSVRLLDPAGAAIAESPGMRALLPVTVFPPPASAEIAAPLKYRSGGKLFSLTSRHVVANEQGFTIQIAQDRSGDELFWREFGTLLLIVLGVSIGASALIASRVTRRSLRPLEEMQRTLQRIGPQNLHERVNPTAWPRELRPLAISFDALLGRLEDSFTRLSQFSADLAHELRTPVANILGETQVALTRERTPAEYRETIESSVTECERLSSIIDNLLFLARTDAAREQIHRVSFNAREAIEKIAVYYQTIAEDRQVEIACSGESDIYADAALFNRALGNLLDNALRYAPAGGQIRIALSHDDTATLLTVSDNGAGLAAEHLPRVFDRFYRADASRSSEGTGLGLALVKSIVDLHGGAATIESAPNHGTTVTLTFPGKRRRHEG
jgi:two-component system heavy metal sensor histidine kinase CusS